MQMDAGLDTGPVLAARACLIAAQDTAGSLTRRLAELGAAAPPRHSGRIRGRRRRVPATGRGVRHLRPEDRQIASRDRLDASCNRDRACGSGVRPVARRAHVPRRRGARRRSGSGASSSLTVTRRELGHRAPMRRGGAGDHGSAARRRQHYRTPAARRASHVRRGVRSRAPSRAWRPSRARTTMNGRAPDGALRETARGTAHAMLVDVLRDGRSLGAGRAPAPGFEPRSPR